jgi:8-oxo-dGTP diphosphatase
MDSRPPKAQPELTVDVVVFTIEDKSLKVVLLKRLQAPARGKLSLPGGFLWQKETTAKATQRTLKDKLGIGGIFVEQLYTFDNPNRDPRGHIITVAHFALAPIEKLKTIQTANNLEIIQVQDAKNLAFDHDAILAYATKRLRAKLGYSNVAYSLLPELFTLSQLQEVYEVILSHPIDKRNFRKKILSLDIIETTDQKITGQRHRPARLHKFKNHSYSELEEPIF